MAPDFGTYRAPVHLDGTTLEGGGQLLRLALSLSSLTKAPVRVTDIRGNRGSKSKPGKGGGLKTSHLAGAEWLAQATCAETVGLEIKSRELTFRPAISVTSLANPSVNDEIGLDGRVPSDEAFWTSIYEGGKRASHITMSTPGSVFLVLQAILPYILFSSAPPQSDAVASQESVPFRLTIDGGTNVDASLSYEYASQVLFPILYSKLGIGPITMTLQHRGWSMGRADVGSVTFEITPLRPRHCLPAFSLVDRGEVVKLHVSVLASTPTARTDIRKLVLKELVEHYPHAEILFPVDEDSRDIKRLYLLLVAETSNGYRLGRDWLYDQKINTANLDKTFRRLVAKVVHDLNNELAHGGCVDEHLQDQLIVFQALADGCSEVACGETSLHTKTAQWVAESLLGPRFSNGSCGGIGFKAGQRQWKKPEDTGSEALAQSLERLNIQAQ